MQTGEKKVTVAAGSSQIVKFDLNPEAAGDQGTLKVVSTVPEAQVFIDGAAVGKVPQEKKLSAGEHPVVVRLDGYKQFEQKVRVEAGQTVTVQATLKAVGRLRILSTPAQADVLINGLPQGGKTPLDIEVEVGETVVRIEAAGFQPFEQTLTIEGGKTQTLSRELAIAGPERGRAGRASSAACRRSARARCRAAARRSTSRPAIRTSSTARINVGAGKIAKKFGFDAGVGVRTMLARNELGLGGRMMLADADPFSAGVFTDLWWGSKLLDDSAPQRRHLGRRRRGVADRAVATSRSPAASTSTSGAIATARTLKRVDDERLRRRSDRSLHGLQGSEHVLTAERARRASTS